jgi:hypothetical protein
MTASLVSSTIPTVIAAPRRLEASPPVGNAAFLRIENFLTLDAAEALHNELVNGLCYERVQIGESTRQWRAEREPGNGHGGKLLTRPGWHTPEIVEECYAFFSSSWFEASVSRLLGRDVVCARSATPYRMTNGDAICAHDDMTDERHAASIVINLTKDWRREYGGNTVIGPVIRVEALPEDPFFPYPMQRLRLSHRRSVLTPRYNSMTVLRLAHGLAHRVTPVRGDGVRYSLTCMFRDAGGSDE